MMYTNKRREDLLRFDEYWVHTGRVKVRATNIGDAVSIAKDTMKRQEKPITISRGKGEVVAVVDVARDGVAAVYWSVPHAETAVMATVWLVLLSGLALSAMILFRLP